MQPAAPDESALIDDLPARDTLAEIEALAVELATMAGAEITAAVNHAVGSMAFSRFDAPHVWDVAGGIPLLRAMGRDVFVRTRGEWAAFGRFDSDDGASTSALHA